MNQRILVLTNSFGGLYSFRKEVMKALVDKGYHVVITAPNKNDDMKVKWFDNIGCRLIEMPFKR